MPSKSKAQHDFMEMVAHNPKAAKRVGVLPSVGKEFVNADKGKKFKSGGEMAKKSAAFKGKESFDEEVKEAKLIKSGKVTPKEYAKREQSEPTMKCGGKTKKYAKGGAIDGIAQRGKTKGRYI